VGLSLIGTPIFSGDTADHPAPYTGMADASGPPIGGANPDFRPGTPQDLALLDTIARAEGAYDPLTGRPRYDIRFGDSHANKIGSLDINKPHPLNVTGSPYSYLRSNASGAYQFLSTTWIAANNGVNKPMTPKNQDAAALWLIRRTTWNHARKNWPSLSGQWASIPTWSGYSAYGQPSHSIAFLNNYYHKRLKYHQAA